MEIKKEIIGFRMNLFHSLNSSIHSFLMKFLQIFLSLYLARRIKVERARNFQHKKGDKEERISGEFIHKHWLHI